MLNIPGLAWEYRPLKSGEHKIAGDSRFTVKGRS